MTGFPTRFTTSSSPASMMSPEVSTPTTMRMTTRGNDLPRQDLRLDFLLLRELRRNGYMGTGSYSRSGSGMTPYTYLPLYGGSYGAGGGSYAPVAAPPAAAQAAPPREQAAERLANRRRAFDESLDERERAPSPEEQLLSRSRGNPPRAEILSGKALSSWRTSAGSGPRSTPRTCPTLRCRSTSEG
jgi:hypothetical protein